MISFFQKRKALKQVRAQSLKIIGNTPHHFNLVGSSYFICYRCREYLYEIIREDKIDDTSPAGETFVMTYLTTLGWVCLRCQEVEDDPKHSLHVKSYLNKDKLRSITDWVKKYTQPDCIQCAHPDYDGFHTCNKFSMETK